MKNKALSSLKSILSLNRRNKLVVTGMLVALLGMTSAIFALNRPDHTSSTASKQTQQTPSSVTSAAITSESPTEATSPTPSPATETPASKPPSTKTASNTPTPSAPKYDNSTAMPPTQVVPIVSFGIVISPWSITRSEPGFIQVPFSIKRIGDHTATIGSLSGQILPTTPGISCIPFFTSGQQLGEIQVTIADSVPDGQYSCKITMSDGVSARSSQFTFTIAGSSITTP